jgi:hypothetical protein
MKGFINFINPFEGFIILHPFFLVCGLTESLTHAKSWCLCGWNPSDMGENPLNSSLLYKIYEGLFLLSS